MKCPTGNWEDAELLAFSADKLEGARAAQLQAHLLSCAACREFVDQQRAVWQALDSWEAPPVASDFDRRLYRRLEENPAWQDRLLRPFRALLTRQGIPIAAAACLIVVASLVSQRPAAVTPPPGAATQVEKGQAEQVEHALDDMQMLSDFTRATRSDGGAL